MYPCRHLIFLILVFCFIGNSFSLHGEEKEKQKGFLGVGFEETKVIRIVAKSSAEVAGLKVGDIVLSISGKNVSNKNDIHLALFRKFAGDTISMKIKRGSKELVKKILLGIRPKSNSHEEMMKKLMANKIDLPKHYKRSGSPMGVPESLRAGLKWLAKQQKEDGSYPFMGEGVNSKFPIGVTSIAGLALLLDNRYMQNTKYTIDFFMKSSNPKGLISHSDSTFKPMWEHAWAMQFLGEAYLQIQRDGAESPLGDYLKKIKPVFIRGIELILETQNADGGWGYRSLADPHTEVGPIASILDALLLARKIGMKIDDDVIQRALRTQVNLMVKPKNSFVQGEWRSFSYEANAFVLASMAPWELKFDTKIYFLELMKISPKNYFKSFVEQTPIKGVYWATGNHTLGLYLSSLAMKRMLKKIDSDVYYKWYREVVDQLTKIQSDQGHWKGWFGDVYGTAFSCLLLGMAEKKLHLFEADDVTKLSKNPIGNTSLKEISLKPKGTVSLSYSVGKAVNSRYKGAGYDATIKGTKIQLKDNKIITEKSIGLLLPAKIKLNSKWTMNQNLVKELFSGFHKKVTGRINASIVSIDDKEVEISLKGLVKFGPPSSEMIQTNSFKGKIIIDLKSQLITQLSFETISGCTRVKTARGYYVTLCDLNMKILMAKKQ